VVLNNQKVLLATSSFAARDITPRKRLEESGVQIIDNPYKRRLTKQELLELLSQGISGIIAGLEPLDREVLEKSQLKVISRCGSGLSNVDLVAAKELGIKVCFTPDGPTQAVAELTLAAMLNLLRLVEKMSSDLHQGKWNKIVDNQLAGKTVAIVGFGRIGQRVAELIKPFNTEIIVVDPAISKTDLGFKVCSLNKALEQADIVTLHCSGEEEIVGSHEIALMKPGVFLLNAARGTLINEAALVEGLETGKVKGAWLDTFNKEPYTGTLTKYDQVLLTPHVGSYTLECRKSMELEAVGNLVGAFINE